MVYPQERLEREREAASANIFPGDSWVWVRSQE